MQNICMTSGGGETHYREDREGKGVTQRKAASKQIGLRVSRKDVFKEELF